MKFNMTSISELWELRLLMQNSICAMISTKSRKYCTMLNKYQLTRTRSALTRKTPHHGKLTTQMSYLMALKKVQIPLDVSQPLNI